MKGVKQPAAERFASKYRITETGCWEWLAGISTMGYGTFNPRPGLRVYAHRWSYEYHVGPIPGGLFVDHRCHDGAVCRGGIACPHRRCVNPAHMELVTNLVNVQRGSKAMKTHCINGHELTDENTYRRPDTGNRQCRACAHERYLQRKSINQGALRPSPQGDTS